MKIIVDSSIFLTRAISSKAKDLYLNLLIFAHDNITCFPSMEHLGELMDKSSKTIQREILELKTYGLIKVYRQLGSNDKRFNNYILVPVEWVDFTTTYCEKDWDLSLEEYNNLKAKVEDFYEEVGISALHPEAKAVFEVEEKAPKKAKKVRVNKTLDIRLDELVKKLDKGSYKYNGADCCLLFAKHLKNKYNLDYSLNNPKNNKIMKTYLVDNGLPNEEIEYIIKTFVDDYNKIIKWDKVKVPEIWMLSKDNMRNSIFIYAEKKMRYERTNTITSNKDYEVVGQAF